MSMALERISGQVFDQPHFYHPGKAETFIRAFGSRITGHQVLVTNGAGGVEHSAFENGRPSAGQLSGTLGRRFERTSSEPFDFVDGVAVIPIEGTLVQKGAFIGQSSGETSYQGLQVQVARAMQQSVKAAVFEVDSYGGMVNGAFPAAMAIRALSKIKPTIAILTDYAYSAAYLLASQCRQIVVPEFGGAGSIGVTSLHADYSGNLEKEGIKITILHSGKHKADGNPFGPLSPELAARWMAQQDEMRDRFAEYVGKGRGKRFSKAAALKTEADSYTASEALALGMVDAVADAQETFAEFVKQANT